MFDRNIHLFLGRKLSPKLTLWPWSWPYLARPALWLFIKEAQNFLKSKVAAKRTQRAGSLVFLWSKLVPFESLGCFCAAGRSRVPLPDLPQLWAMMHQPQSSLKWFTAFNGLNSLPWVVPESVSQWVNESYKRKGKIRVPKRLRRFPHPNWSRYFLSLHQQTQCWATTGLTSLKKTSWYRPFCLTESQILPDLAVKLKRCPHPHPVLQRKNCLTILVMFTGWTPSRIG